MNTIRYSFAIRWSFIFNDSHTFAAFLLKCNAGNWWCVYKPHPAVNQRGFINPIRRLGVNPFSATRRYKCHHNKVKVKGLGRNSSYLAGFLIFFFSWFYEKFNQLAKKKKTLIIFLSSISSKVAIKFSKNFFFLPKIGLALKGLKLIAWFFTWKPQEWATNNQTVLQSVTSDTVISVADLLWVKGYMGVTQNLFYSTYLGRFPQFGE